MSQRVLLVDDDASVGTVLVALLRQAEIECTFVGSGEEALATLEREPIDAMVTDVRMPGMDGLELMRRAQELIPALPVVVITAHGTIPLAVEALKSGASDFVLKPFEREEILFIVRKALEIARRTGMHVPAAPPSSGIVGASACMRALFDRMERVAQSDATALITGETGTGKGLIARALHEAGARAEAPFVTVQCAALPAELLESELFGYEPGAFTGATSAKPGRVELAEGGTLFIDEIGDVPLALQVRLLRLLQEREYERLGGTQTSRADVRFMAATHRDLATLVAEGRFREDLYFRLDVLPVHVPPLREREGDTAALASHFAQRHGGGRVLLTAGALASLAAMPWPGNVRQLENFIERLVVLADGPEITSEDVAREAGGAALGTPPAAAGETLEDCRREAEANAVQRALQRSGGNRSKAARLLGVSRRTLYNKLEELGLGS